MNWNSKSPNRRLKFSGGDSFLVNPYMSIVTSYRVHTIVIGRNLPVIIQRLPAKPVMDAMPLLRLMLQANARPLEDELLQVVAGPGT